MINQEENINQILVKTFCNTKLIRNNNYWYEINDLQIKETIPNNSYNIVEFQLVYHCSKKDIRYNFIGYCLEEQCTMDLETKQGNKEIRLRVFYDNDKQIEIYRYNNKTNVWKLHYKPSEPKKRTKKFSCN
ncbi:MAG: hypothetical protein Q4G04_03095 [bacterium]|nr:hypothetical protein [bacterium]